MLDPDTRIKSKFLTEEGKHINGVIESSQEGGGVLARGYFINFDDVKYTLFLNEKCLYELYDIVYEPIDETVYNIDDKGQLSFI